jgi:VCBS repeat-containing protein
VDGNLFSTQLSALNGTLQIDISDGASISNGANNTNTFTLRGTQGQINAALATLSYQSNLHFNGSDTLTLLSIDSAGTPLRDNDEIIINVVAINDAPQIVEIDGNTLTFTENEGKIAVSTLFSVSDIDSANLESATIRIAQNYVATEDVLSIVQKYGISGTWNSTTGTLLLTGTASVADYEAAISSVTYLNTSESPNNAIRTLNFTVNDGLADSNVQTKNISVTSVNDAPTGNPIVVNALEETLTTINVMRNIFDVDGTIDVTKTAVSQGPINGILVNNADGTFSYQANPDFFGNDSFTYTVEDNLGQQSSDISVSINVININDSSVIGGNKNGTANFGTIAAGVLTATDPDGLTDGQYFSVAESVSKFGTAAIDAKSGAWTFSPFDATWSGSDSFTVVDTDDNGDTTEQLVNVTIFPDSEPPVLPKEEAAEEVVEETVEEITEEPEPVVEEIKDKDEGSATTTEKQEVQTETFTIPQIIDGTQLNDPIMNTATTNSNLLSGTLPIENVLAERYSNFETRQTIDTKQDPIQTAFIDLQNLDIAPSDSQTIGVDYSRNSDSTVSFSNEFETMRISVEKSMESNENRSMRITEAVLGVTLPIMAGAASWVLRAGTLLTSFVSFASIWRQLDVMPIISAKNKSGVSGLGGNSEGAGSGNAAQSSAEPSTLDENIFNSENAKRK